MTDPLPLQARFRHLAALYEHLANELATVADNPKLLEPYPTTFREMATTSSLAAHAFRLLEAETNTCPGHK